MQPCSQSPLPAYIHAHECDSLEIEYGGAAVPCTVDSRARKLHIGRKIYRIPPTQHCVGECCGHDIIIEF